MAKELRFRSILENAVSEIQLISRTADIAHGAGDIRDSGDIVENLIRNKLELFLPERYLVKKGHIIDSDGNVSNQFDIIIFDRLNTPKFFESSDDTVYYPIESVLAIGEIKKTLYKNDIGKFTDKIEYLKTQMKHELVVNSVFGGDINQGTSIDHMLNMDVTRKHCNSLFTFIIAIDVDNYNELQFPINCKYMPNDIYILNKCALIYGKINPDKSIDYFVFDENPDNDSLIQIDCTSYICFGMLLNNLINHLNKSYIRPYSISKYMTNNSDFAVIGSSVKMFKIRT